MYDIKVESCSTDPEFWTPPATKNNDTTYCQYVFLYIGDIVCNMENPKEFLKTELSSLFILKENSIALPTQYLGNKVSQVTLEDRTNIHNALNNIEENLAKRSDKLLPRAKYPWSTDPRLEADISPELSSSDAKY